MIRIKKDEIEMEGTGLEILTDFGSIAAQVRMSMIKEGVSPKEATEVLRSIFNKSIELSEQEDKPGYEEKAHVIHVRSADEALKIISEFLGGKR